ncbi:DNA/RNA helicase, superfamily I [Actinoalloteichus sp. GBA129-24]|uniref:DNA/RNA helicase, superfamily I n=2 Tax=Actinoalloteichus TaxID=65496 RepID=A0AAC9LFE8_9PSEU|nr:AAA family ATPase [Actinoalloteichus fjordicus]APU16696.1 DNA/RNA helicase, superfamily I [Actinoalloteichus fjordicus]APU22762.1 DNA/RNA helicase, superfamily I [Actinoalloteichus sp. GBA129-24]
MLYGRVDELRKETTARHAAVLGQEHAGTPQAWLERDIAAAMYAEELTRLRDVEEGLYFGRLDLASGGRRHIGRLGLSDDSEDPSDGNDYEPLLMDWRAPAARPFYTATAASPEDVRMRRHVRTRARKVLTIDDEVLDLAAAESAGSGSLTGEAALLAAMSRSRTGRMTDIVATIQQEQDRIIRSPRSGVLVVQGGPGTGKTAVALHRTAYLLYTHRDQLAKRGTLVIGPNPTFLRYISQVLPSLGETGVVLSTVAELYPGITATRQESAAVAALKGDAAMIKLMAAAVKDRQTVPRKPIEIQVDREAVVIDRAMVTQARGRARRSRRPHNDAKEIFLREMFSAMTLQIADRLGRHLLDRADLDDIKEELSSDDGVRATLDELWPTLTPQRLLRELFGSPKRLATAARRLYTEEQCAAMLRADGDGWTAADIPLLDEADELLGEDSRTARKQEEQARRAEIAYAQGVLDILDMEEDLDPELLRAVDIVDAAQLASRQEERRYETTAARAAADRTWTYGHVVVDEAQELSAMAWRVLMRRCPSKSMTLVGDVAQTGAEGGADSWSQVLGPYVAERWRLEELTVNYRTPTEIMAVAADVAAAIDPDLRAPQSVRDTGVPPWSLRVPPGTAPQALTRLVADEVDEVDDGRIAVLVPAAHLNELTAALADEPSAVSTPGASGDLTAQTTVLTVEQAKGLEFDSVLVVEPQAILDESPRGLNDLYVAITRTTRRLGVLHTGDLPAVLSGLHTRVDSDSAV